MKIIELLNKIANGEEVPNEIKYDNFIYWYDETDDNELARYRDMHGEWLFIDCYLNDEVEIIEDTPKEEKKIPEKLETFKDRNNVIFLDDSCCKYIPIHKDSLSFNEQVIVDKLNEVLNYLKSKGE